MSVPPPDDDAARLRREAEDRLRDGKASHTRDTLSAEDATRLLHELRVHQLELEMQNEELRRSQLELDLSRSRYFELYDLAPVSYLTLDAAGLVQLANLTATTLLGVSRQQVLGQPFSRFISPLDADTFYLLSRQLLAAAGTRSCRVRMVQRSGGLVWVHLVAMTRSDFKVKLINVVLTDITDTVRADEGRRESEEQLEEAQAITHFGSWTHSLETGEGTWSKGMFNLHSVPQVGSAQPPDALDFIHPEDRELVTELTTAVVTVRTNPARGPERVHEVRRTVITDATGRPIQVRGITFDVTDRVRAERQQRELLERFSLTLAASNQGWFDVNVQTGEAQVGPNYARMLGYEPDTFVETNQRWLDRLHPDDRERVGEVYRRYMAGQLPTYRVEFRQRTQQGEWKWLLSVGSVVAHDANGAPLRMLGTHTDIHHLKTLEMSLQETTRSLSVALGAAEQTAVSLRRFKSAIDQAPDAIVITDRDGLIQFVNPAFVDMTGWPAGEAMGKTMSLVSSGLTAPKVYEDLWKTILSGKTWRGELRNRRRDGRLYWTMTSIAPVHDAAGLNAHFVAVQADISEQKRLEAQVLRTQRLESTGALASGVAHDLNNLLAPILVFSSLLRDPTSPSWAQWVKGIDDSARSCVAVVQRLLAFGRGSDDAFVDVEAGALATDFTRWFSSTLPAEFSLRSELRGDELVVNADPTQLRQVLLNLCVNARDAMPAGGVVQVVVDDVTLEAAQLEPGFSEFWQGARPGHWVRFVVADTGTGISAEVREHLFEPFFTTKAAGKGTGLGLATVAQICRRHHGFVRVESALEKGTRFEVYLPASEAAPATTPEAVVGGGRLVLVADDEPLALEAVRQALEQSGFRVLTARDGVELVELAAAQTPALVVTDVSMPRLDGVAALERIRVLLPSVPVMFITGGSSSMLPVGIPALRKPFTATQLLSTVARALER